ncbi:DUF6357 family protein, partial [Streptomyces sp. NPDC059556]|uniref:DUF6357 family protein n=1 Tax=Streptomyces sp. NPDC059556 TaxID=3346863 RepID=UPI0036ACED52
MKDIVYTRMSGWIPNVIREDGELKLMLGAGADANHEPRTFTFPITEAHCAVIQEDLARHLLLWSAVLPLCEAAGTRGLLDEDAAVALLDPILLAEPWDVGGGGVGRRGGGGPGAGPPAAPPPRGGGGEGGGAWGGAP